MKIEQKSQIKEIEIGSLDAGVTFALPVGDKHHPCMFLSFRIEKEKKVCHYYDYAREDTCWCSGSDPAIPIIILPESKIIWKFK